MLLKLDRLRRAPKPVDLWSPQFRESQVPASADGRQLQEFLLRMEALVELRAAPGNTERAKAIVQAMDLEIRGALDSPTKHRDWREARPRVVDLLNQLGQVLYEEVQPETPSPLD